MPITPASPRVSARRVCVLGATGTIGRATAAMLVRRGYDVVCLLRAASSSGGSIAPAHITESLSGARIKVVDFADAKSLARNGFGDEAFDAVISCMASRTGAPRDAWTVDYRAQLNALDAARRVGVGHFVLLSALCVQKPLLAFKHAKLAFEAALIESGLRYSIVRPTAFFKSLSGQVERVRKGKPYLIFGDGTLTSCKPISDDDLADFIVGCLDDADRWNRILPIGGPGDAITPRQQGDALFRMMRREPRFKSVPLALLNVIIGALGAIGRVVPSLADKAELARIGRYYATESMLVLNPQTGRYDAEVTPATGTQSLFDFYRSILAGEVSPERGDHAVF